MSSYEQFRHSLISVGKDKCVMESPSTLLDAPLDPTKPPSGVAPFANAAALDACHSDIMNADATAIANSNTNTCANSDQSSRIRVVDLGPFLCIQDFLSHWIQRVSQSPFGSIREATSNTAPGGNSSPASTFSVLGNRFCERIGRQHKSNHIYFVVHWTRHEFRQGCFDPDCRDYAFPWRSLPCTKPEDEVIDDCWDVQ